MTAHVLRNGLYFAGDRDEGLVLDIVEDRYLALDAAGADLWRAVLGEHGVPGSPFERDAETQSMLESWIEMRLLVPADTPQPVVPRSKPAGVPAATDLEEEPATAATRACASARFAASTWAMAIRIRRRGLATTLDDVCADRPPMAIGPAASANQRLVRRLVPDARGSLRDDCLPRSLAAARFLWRAGLPADLCFGAQKFPFQAHAWIEVGGRSVTDSAARLQRFRVLARF